jgi:hypothetical protein
MIPRTSRAVRSSLVAPVVLMVSSLAVAGAVAAFGCGGGEASGVAASKLPEGSRSEAVEHEACSESGHRVEVLDADGDGKPDIKRVYDKSTGKEICRISDLNHDGKPDLYEYYDQNGVIRRREADYDDNGVIDAIEYYENGKLVRREYDTTGQHRIDTWDYFDSASGKRMRRERDTSNDGKVDQWWTFDGDKVTIAMDKNGDGKPDPENTIVMGGSDDGGPPAPSAPKPGAAQSNAPAKLDYGDAAPQASPFASPSSSSSADASVSADAGPKRKEKR